MRKLATFLDKHSPSTIRFYHYYDTKGHKFNHFSYLDIRSYYEDPKDRPNKKEGEINFKERLVSVAEYHERGKSG